MSMLTLIVEPTGCPFGQNIINLLCASHFLTIQICPACVNIEMGGLQEHINPFTAEIQLNFVHLVRRSTRGQW